MKEYEGSEDLRHPVGLSASLPTNSIPCWAPAEDIAVKRLRALSKSKCGLVTAAAGMREPPSLPPGDFQKKPRLLVQLGHREVEREGGDLSY